jgi:hypothetical protein
MQRIRKTIRLFTGQLSEKFLDNTGTTQLLNRISKDEGSVATIV